MLSTKVGKEIYVEHVIEGDTYRFTVKVGKPKDAEAAKRGTKSGGSGSSFLCLMSHTPMPFEYIRTEAKAGRMGARLIAVVVVVDRGRQYVPPSPAMEALALSARPMDPPDTDLPIRALGFRVQEYGMTKWRDLFTPRQLVALTNFSDLIGETRMRVKSDALATGMLDDAAYKQTVDIAKNYGVIKNDPDPAAARTDLAKKALEGLDGDTKGTAFKKATVELKEGGK